MKKAFVTTILSMAVGVTLASPIDKSAALEKARAFMTKVNPSATIAEPSMRRKVASASTEEQPYYIFNADNEQGFVIVSGDNRSEEIIGYADQGTIDPDNMPDALKAMLDGFAEQLQELDEAGLTEPVANSRGARKVLSTGRQPIAPLTTSKWAQGAPWTDKLPNHNKNGSTAKPPQGCGICCLSQMVYYWKYLHMTKPIPAYTMNSTYYEGTFPELPVREFNFDLMQDDYTYSSYTSAQKEEISTLTLYILQAMKSRFTHEHATSTSSSNVPTVFPNYFGYKVGVRISRSTMSPYEFENLVYNDIRQGLPVILTGSNPEWGHFFIADGYSYDGYFHINWGWGGQADGYFLMSPLSSINYPSNRGFSNAMAGIFGFRPNAKYDRNPDYDPNAYEPYKSLDDFTLRLRTLSFFNGTVKEDGGDSLMFKDYSIAKGEDGKYSFKKLQIRSYLENFCDVINTNVKRSFDTDIAIYDGDYNYVGSFGAQQIAINSRGNGVAYYDLKDIDLPDGEYYFVHRSRATESRDKLFHFSEQNGYYDYAHVKATIADGKMTVSLVKAIEFESVELLGQCSANRRTNIRFHVRNNSFNKVERVYNLYRNVVRDKDDEILQDNKGMYIPARTTAYFDMDFNPGTEDGKLILYNRDQGRTDYTYEYTINQNPASMNLSCSWHIDNTSGSYLYGNELTGYVTVTNNSNTEYSELLTIMAYTGEVAHNGSQKYAAAMYPVRIPARGSVDLDISKLYYADEYHPFSTGLTYGNTFTPYLCYTSEGKQSSISYKQFKITRGVMWWDKKGKLHAEAFPTGSYWGSSTTYTVNSEAVAVSFVGWSASNKVTIKPNSNPNCLYYFSNQAGANRMSTTTGKNIIINGVASNNITFSDNYGAFVPITFTAQKKVSYTRQFTNGFEGNEETRGWSTICLPFDVQKITNKEQNVDIDFFRYPGDLGKNFWLRKLYGMDFHTLYFDYPTSMEANVPYIISVPGESFKEFGDGWCLTGKDIVFSAENTEVVSGLSMEDCDDFNLVSATTAARNNGGKSLYGFEGTESYFTYLNTTAADYNGYKPFRVHLTGDVVPASSYEKKVKVAQRFPMDVFEARELIEHRFPAIRFASNGLAYEVPAWDEVVTSDVAHTRLQIIKNVEAGETVVPVKTVTSRAWSAVKDPAYDDFAYASASDLGSITIGNVTTTASNLTYGEACDLLGYEIAEGDRDVKVLDVFTPVAATEFMVPAQLEVTDGVNAGRTFVVERIGAGTYRNATNLTYDVIGKVANMTIPEGIKVIERGAFQNNGGLKKVVVNPNSKLEVIEAEAFENCRLLQEINIPASVGEIMGTAFGGCTKLNKMTFEGNEPPVLARTVVDGGYNGYQAYDPFTANARYASLSADVTKKKCAIYVPAKKVSAYRETDELWGEFIFATPVSATKKFVSFSSDVPFTTYMFNGSSWQSGNIIQMYWADRSKNNSSSSLTLSATKDNQTATIPAGFGLVMKTSSTGGSGYIFMPPTGVANKAGLDADNNMMKGLTVDTQMKDIVEANPENTYYILTNNNFVKVTDGVLSAGRAYLEMPNSLGSEANARMMFSLEDNETDGIRLINGEEQGFDEAYDLQGRKIVQPKKGMYIKNGKKIIK